MEELVDMDTNILSEHQQNDHIEIEQKEEANESATKSQSKGKQVARKSTKRAKCWEHFAEIKENDERVASKSVSIMV